MVVRCSSCQLRLDAPAGTLPLCPQCSGPTSAIDNAKIEAPREIPNPPRTLKFSRRQILRAS